MSTPAVISIRDQGALELIRVLLQQGVTVRLRVSGISMLPLISEGDLVEVSPVEEKKLRRGDIVFFCDQQENPFIHRLHRCQSDLDNVLLVQTKGDACAWYDPAIPINRVLGRVQRIMGERGATDLRAPIIRWRARLLVARTTSFFLLRRTVKMYGLF
ncbi:signal peptidase I [Candidatus Electrothrix aarhusensis]|uniref:Signal peptidase I n=1 Tax=Candidatus Electrothrix aarhusensis TaxID=1859131 RepID=A0A3S3R0U2_9BACT|nr:signal peptidase I [Candidatus Electrothrix aarhusensis]